MNDLEYQAPEIKETEKFYKRSRWWIGHREGLRRAGLGLWMFIDVLLVSFALWVMVDTFLISFEGERGLLRSMLIENQTSLYENTQAEAAEPMRIEGTPTVLASSETAYDFLGFITNPNENWWADFSYQFTYGSGEETELRTAFVYPGETRPVVALGEEISRPSNVKLRIPDLRWHRIDPHAVADFDLWKSERLDLLVENAEFTSIGGGSDDTIGRSTFSVTNKSAFSYWSVPLTIMLKRGSSVIGVNTTMLEQLEAGEQAEIELSWFQPLPTVNEIEVIPTLNIFDGSVYMTPRAERSLDTRTNFGL